MRQTVSLTYHAVLNVVVDMETEQVEQVERVGVEPRGAKFIGGSIGEQHAVEIANRHFARERA